MPQIGTDLDIYLNFCLRDDWEHCCRIEQQAIVLSPSVDAVYCIFSDTV